MTLAPRPRRWFTGSSIESSGYQGSGVAIPAIKDGTYSMAVALAMLEGDGVKITDVPYAPPVISTANLSQWIEPGWTASTNALGDGPPSAGADHRPAQHVL